MSFSAERLVQVDVRQQMNAAHHLNRRDREIDLHVRAQNHLDFGVMAVLGRFVGAHRAASEPDDATRHWADCRLPTSRL